MSNDNLNHLAEELGRSLCRCASGQCDLLANDLGSTAPCSAYWPRGSRYLQRSSPRPPAALGRTCSLSFTPAATWS